jgi:hypothetical protein
MPSLCQIFKPSLAFLVSLIFQLQSRVVFLLLVNVSFTARNRKVVSASEVHAALKYSMREICSACFSNLHNLQVTSLPTEALIVSVVEAEREVVI